MSRPDTFLSDADLDRRFRQLTAEGRLAEEAMSALYRHYDHLVLKHLGFVGLDVQSAEDVLQTVFIKLMQQAGQWRGEGSPNAWFWRIVRNAAMDHFRARRREVGLDDEGWAMLIAQLPAVEPDMGAEELRRCVLEAFQRFARAHPERAEAVGHLLQEDWHIAEIAQVLDRTPGATRQFLSQCRKVFRTFVEPCRVWLTS